jgi:hypothetical protein
MMRSHNRYADPVASLGELCQELVVTFGSYACGGLVRAARTPFWWAAGIDKHDGLQPRHNDAHCRLSVSFKARRETSLPRAALALRCLQSSLRCGLVHGASRGV